MNHDLFCDVDIAGGLVEISVNHHHDGDLYQYIKLKSLLSLVVKIN